MVLNKKTSKRKEALAATAKSLAEANRYLILKTLEKNAVYSPIPASKQKTWVSSFSLGTWESSGIIFDRVRLTMWPWRINER